MVERGARQRPRSRNGHAQGRPGPCFRSRPPA